MKKLLIGIGKKSKKAFSDQVDVKKKNKVLKDYCILINKNCTFASDFQIS